MSDFSTFHHDTLPDLLAAGRNDLLAGQHLPALGLRVTGESESFTYETLRDGVRIRDGVAAADVWVELDIRDWRGLLNDVETIPAILYGKRIRRHHGDLMQLMRWEAALRALYTGRPIYDPERFRLVDREGNALDPKTAFTLDDDPSLLRRFLDAAGYLLVRGVFTANELQRFRAAAAELARTARQGDQDSWWGRDDQGRAVLCRNLVAGRSAAFRGLYEDRRMLSLQALLPAGMQHPLPDARDGIALVYKNPGMKEGLSDLPWHRDCGMGGHAVMCPSFVVSIYLYDATPQRGPLQFLPGSHRYAFAFADPTRQDIPGAVTVPARAGDVTVHIGDVMHAAPPPSARKGPYRQSALLSFHPAFEHHRGERHYNDVLLGARDGQVAHLRDAVPRS